LKRDRLVIPDVNKKTSFRGWLAGEKMTSLGSTLIALVCHPTINLNKAE
jgi:hypothetical protein